MLLATATFSSMATDNYVNLLGEAVPPTTASRTITIHADAAYVNATGGEIVKFVVDNKTFTWDFDTAGNISEIDPNKIAPPGVVNHMVNVYVARDPTYLGGV